METQKNNEKMVESLNKLAGDGQVFIYDWDTSCLGDVKSVSLNGNSIQLNLYGGRHGLQKCTPN